MRKIAGLILMLTLSACQVREKQFAPVILSLPPLPYTQTPLPQARMPDLKCLQTTGQPCPGHGSSKSSKNTTSS